MENHLSDLVKISRFYGRKKDYVIAGGGNTSYKNNETVWVKGSGTSLDNIAIEDFAVLSRALLKNISTRNYSADSATRESEVKEDLENACLKHSKVRPSVETSLHEIINYPFVVHTHPTLVNAITCSVRAKETIHELFGDAALYIPYTDPGYVLFAKVRDSLMEWRTSHAADPGMIFLENHGVFAAAGSIQEIQKIYNHIESAIREKISHFPDTSAAPVPGDAALFIPAFRMMLSSGTVKVARIRNNELIARFTGNEKAFGNVSLPFTPDQIVYGKAKTIYLQSNNPDDLISEFKRKLDEFVKQNGYQPKVVGIKNYGIAAFDDNIKSVNTILDVFDDRIQISYLSENFGGPHFMSERDIAFIDNWEVENYRRAIAKGGAKARRAENRIVVVTGGAQGFGEGIVRSMFSEGANVVIADVNTGKGASLAEALNAPNLKNEVVFVKTDITDPSSVDALMTETVKSFGGLDVFISNAGILRAGGLDEMTPETFELMTKVDYSGYFLCARSASRILKLQATVSDGYFTDIIQINSKSGLKGSNKNFAYAGAKFGGIGLTQSFALELMPWKIKVNAICPGNFFEGPLWSDPEKGLFVQYLKAGKVAGAKTIADVKAHYEKQVPAGRGCRVEDVMKAIYYVIEQEYETGQAIPVTGGQEMLS